MGPVQQPSRGVLHKFHRARRPAHGFTLIELMLVVVIIGVLSSFAFPYFQRMTSRARRTEINIVFDKLHVFFVNQYENNGTFSGGDATVTTNTQVAFNPPAVGPPVGQASAWNSSIAGWQQIPFTFDGGLKLRYSYLIATGGLSMTLTALGQMPGLGASTITVGTLSGNYLYTETLQGTSITSVEVPSM